MVCGGILIGKVNLWDILVFRGFMGITYWNCGVVGIANNFLFHLNISPEWGARYMKPTNVTSNRVLKDQKK